MKKDIVVKRLIIESDREEHIAKHKITIEEVIEIVSGDYVYIQAKEERWLLIGKTIKDRFISIVVGQRKLRNTYGFVTARPSRKEEKSFYEEVTLEGGENNDKS